MASTIQPTAKPSAPEPTNRPYAPQRLSSLRSTSVHEADGEADLQRRHLVRRQVAHAADGAHELEGHRRLPVADAGLGVGEGVDAQDGVGAHEEAAPSPRRAPRPSTIPTAW